MVLEHAAAYLAGLGASLWGRTLDGADLFNGTFGSLVAVTGDAHQAQVAQDIFRQEVRIERSLRVREDIRDAHQLMIENVQTQLLMGNLVLGICFTVLIEGRPSYPSRAPVLVQELWAVFAVWSISLNFLAVWFALQYQERVSVSSRKRLLEKHRVTTPNDEVVGRMGGLSLAEKVDQLHRRGLDELVEALESKVGCHGARERLGRAIAELIAQPGEVMESRSGKEQKEIEAPPLELKAGTHGSIVARAATERAPVEVLGPDMRFQDLLCPHLEVRICGHGQRRGPMGEDVSRSSNFVTSNTEPTDGSADDVASRPLRFGEFMTVRAARGTRAWFDEEAGTLSPHHIVDLPDFLVDETLVRCPWSMPVKRRRRSIRFMVRGAATLYVAAQWPRLDSREPLRNRGPPPGWTDEEMPVLHGSKESFQRVEGFTLLVSDRTMELPLYRAALEEPNSRGWRKVRLEFRFAGPFVAPVIFVRRGAIVTSEEDWPVREFFNELDEIQPLRDDSMSYMSQGLVSLLLAAFFAHLGRISTDRTWPNRKREIALVLIAICPALVIACHANRLMKHMFKDDFSSLPTLSAEQHRRSLRSNQSQRDPEHELLGRVSRKEASAEESSRLPAASPRSFASTSPCKGTLEPHEHLPSLLESGSLRLPSIDKTSPHARAQQKAPVVVSAESANSSAPASSIVGRGFLNQCHCGPALNGTCVEEWRQDREEEELVVAGSAGLFGRLHLPIQKGGDDHESSDTGASSEEESAELDEVSSPMITSMPGKSPRRKASGWSSGTELPWQTPLRRVWRVCRWPWQRSHESGSSQELVSGRAGGSSSSLHINPVSIFKYGVRILWFTSIASIVVGRILPSHLNGNEWQASETCAVEGPWAVHQVEWPTPLFTPSAAAFAPDGRTLWLASDWLLAPLSVSAEDTAIGVNVSSVKVGKVTRLPVAAKGLWIPPSDERIVVIGEDAIHPLELPDSASEGASVAAVSALHPTVVRSSMVTMAGAPLPLPSMEIGGNMVAAAAAGLPAIGSSGQGGGAGAMVIAMAPEARGVFLSAAAQLQSRNQTATGGGEHDIGRVEVALKVPEQPGGAQVRALHICAEPAQCGAPEPVLWAVDNSGCLSARGLGSGRVLVAWQWAARGLSTASSIALAGNASHLFLVTPCFTGQTAVLLSAPYAALLSDETLGTDGCHVHP